MKVKAEELVEKVENILRRINAPLCDFIRGDLVSIRFEDEHDFFKALHVVFGEAKIVKFVDVGIHGVLVGVVYPIERFELILVLRAEGDEKVLGKAYKEIKEKYVYRE